MKHIDIKKIFENKRDFIGKTVTVCGWVRTSRDSKNTAFLELNDGTSFRHLQIVIDKSAVTDAERFLPLCSAVEVRGDCVNRLFGQSGVIKTVGKSLRLFP